MRFYGNGVVWDAENDKRLCKFSRSARGEKGVFETDDKRICAELIRMGYEPGDTPDPTATAGFTPNPKDADGNPAAPPDIVTPDLGAKKLREIGKELGLSFPVGTTKTDMVAAINAKREETK